MDRNKFQNAIFLELRGLQMHWFYTTATNAFDDHSEIKNATENNFSRDKFTLLDCCQGHSWSQKF